MESGQAELKPTPPTPPDAEFVSIETVEEAIDTAEGGLLSVWRWIDDRTGIGKLAGPVLTHRVPRSTASGKAGWMYIFGLATLTAFIVQVVTGIALATEYIPSSSDAYSSLQFITNNAALGHFLRGVHYFGASAMIIFIGVHLIRVFLTGSYKYPREMNWLTGTVLLAATLGMAFTGQTLRWDESGYWSLTIAAEMAGRTPVIGTFIARFIVAGKFIGASTLVRFFAFHVFFIPAIIFAVVGLHLWLVIHNGISEPPKQREPIDRRRYRAWYHDLIERDGVPYFPDGAWHEVVFGFVVVAGILLLALLFGPPVLGQAPSPSIIHVQPRPDWYFLWYFAVLALARPEAENYIIIGIPLIIFAFLFALPFIGGRGTRNPLERPWAVGLACFVVVYVATMWAYGAIAPWSPNFDTQPLSAQAIGASSGPLFDGAQVFYQKGCQYCHTVNGHGGIRGPDLSNVGRRLSPGEITAIIDQGFGNMPSYVNNITPQQMEQLVAFLASRQAKTGAQ